MEREDKKTQFDQPAKRSSLPLVAIAFCVVVAAGLAFVFLGEGSSIGNPDVKPVRADRGEVSIPLAQVSDGKAHFFTISSGGADVRFFVLKSDDGVVRAAFDTCDVCYRYNQGYRQEGDSMVCNACDQRFRSDLVNEIKGGCNPAPLERRVTGESLIIAEADITRGAWYFKGN